MTVIHLLSHALNIGVVAQSGGPGYSVQLESRLLAAIPPRSIKPSISASVDELVPYLPGKDKALVCSSAGHRNALDGEVRIQITTMILFGGRMHGAAFVIIH